MFCVSLITKRIIKKFDILMTCIAIPRVHNFIGKIMNSWLYHRWLKIFARAEIFEDGKISL